MARASGAPIDVGETPVMRTVEDSSASECDRSKERAYSVFCLHYWNRGNWKGIERHNRLLNSKSYYGKLS